MNFPQVENYGNLIPVARAMHAKMEDIAWQMLLPAFLLSIAFAYSRDLGVSGTVLVRLKRLIVTAILLAAFPMIAEFVKSLGLEIALSLDNLGGIDTMLDAISKTADTYAQKTSVLERFGSNFFQMLLMMTSFIAVALARLFVIAYQHFYWLVLDVLSPFLIMGHLFDSTSHITKNLFKNVIQVSSWPIIWAILSAFLRAIPFAKMYAPETGYTAIAVMNFILAIALFRSPRLIGEFSEGAILAAGEGIHRAGSHLLMSIPNKFNSARKLGSKALGWWGKAEGHWGPKYQAYRSRREYQTLMRKAAGGRTWNPFSR